MRVTLIAGQPISFVYDLATSRVPVRRVVEDQTRAAAGPVELECPSRTASPPSTRASPPSNIKEENKRRQAALEAGLTGLRAVTPSDQSPQP